MSHPPASAPDATTDPARDAATGTGTGPGPARWAALPVLVAAQFIVILDASIVNIAIPTIETDLGFAATDLQWIINAYVLAFGGLLLLGGRLTDLVDGRRVFLAGLAVFGVASAACALAETPAVLLAARAAQGVGAALLSPAGLSLLTAGFTGRRRAVALGAWGAVSGVAGAAGVLLGGVLTDGPGWEWIFWINVPVVLVVGLATLRLVAPAGGDRRTGLDVPGSVMVTGAVTALVFGVVSSEEHGWTSGLVLGAFAVAAGLLVAFVLVERRTADPLVPLAVFRLRNLSVGNSVSVVFGGVQLATFFVLTLYLQQVRGESAQDSGLAYLPLAAAAFVGSGLASALLPRLGARLPLAAGMTMLAVGSWWFSLLEVDSDLVGGFLLPSLLWGTGLGLAAVAVLAAATEDLGGEGESGLASGLFNTTQQVGAAVGLAVLSTLAFDRVAERAATGVEPRAALLDGLQLALQVGAGLAAVGAVVALVGLRRAPDPEQGRPPAGSSAGSSAGASAQTPR